MKIQLIGEELVLTDSYSHVQQIRGLPSRRWNAGSGQWHCAYVQEVYDQMVALKFPVDHIDPPRRSGFRVEKATKNNEVFWAVYTLPTPQAIQACKALPDWRTWSPTLMCWVCKPSQQNHDHLKQQLPQLVWTKDAQKLFALFDDGGTARRLSRSENNVRAREMTRALDKPVDFQFTTKPYDHQVTAFQRMTDMVAFALFMEQGTGKTKCAIDDAYRLFDQGKIQGVVVVCPNSVKTNWEEEIKIHGKLGGLADIFVWNNKTKRKAAEWISKKDTEQLDWFVLNVDAFSQKPTAALLHEYAARYSVLMLVDESTRIKSIGALRTKGVIKAGRAAKYRRILTGTPVTQGPLDLYSQFQFLDSRILGFSSYYTFRNHFAIMGGWNAKQIVGYKNLDELQALIAPYSYRVTKDECLDLPDKIYQKLVVQLTPKQRALYDQMKETMVAETSDGKKITTQYAIVQMMRLQQITGGFVSLELVDDEGAITDHLCQPVDEKNPKIDALLELVNDVQGKVIIWARYRAELQLISQSLAASFGEASVVEFHGGISEVQRTKARRDFQDASSAVRFFVGQTETGGVGLTLTQAKTVVYFSNSFSLESRVQSEDRAHRIGQTDHVTYVDLVAEDTLDMKVLGALRGKKNLANLITGDQWKQWL